MRFRNLFPSLAGIVLVAVLAGSAVRSSNELIRESEQMRFTDRTALTDVRASQAERILVLVSQLVSGMARATPFTGAPGSAADKAMLDGIVRTTYGRIASAVVVDRSGNVTAASSDGGLIPPATDSGYADLRLPRAANPLRVSRAMFAGGVSLLGFAADFGPATQPLGTLVTFSRTDDANGFRSVTVGPSVASQKDGRAGLILYDRDLVVLSGVTAADTGTRLPNLAAYRAGVGAKAGHVQFEENGVRQVLIHVPVGTTGLTMAYVQDASSFFGPLRAKHERSNLLLFGVIALLGMVMAFVAARRHQLVQRSEDRLNALFRSAADVVAVLRHGRLTFVSAGVERLVGSTPDELLGMDPVHLLERPDDVAPFEELVSLAAASPGTEVTTELAFAHSDGRPRYVEIAAVDLTSDAAVGGVVLTLHDVTERKALESEITHRSLHDPLTELPNRTLFHDRLTQAVSRLARSGRAVAIMYMDLDRFKPINDELGHGAGDHVLREVAARLRSVVRPNDTVARLGGDEFAVLVEDLDDHSIALDLAGRLAAAVAGPVELETGSVTVGASIGLAFGEGPGVDGDTLVHNADLAMYMAKAQGGGGIEWFGPHLGAGDRAPA